MSKKIFTIMPQEPKTIISEENKKDKYFPYMVNCLIKLRADQLDVPPFLIEDRLIVPKLDGYAIVPLEDYEELTSIKEEVEKNVELIGIAAQAEGAINSTN